MFESGLGVLQRLFGRSVLRFDLLADSCESLTEVFRHCDHTLDPSPGYSKLKSPAENFQNSSTGGQFVCPQPGHKFLIGIAFYRNSTNQFADEVLAIKSALACAFVDSNLRNCLLNLLARNYLFRSPVFGRFEF
jgi:hypothetical protein